MTLHEPGSNRPPRGTAFSREEAIELEDRVRIRISALENQNRGLRRTVGVLSLLFLVPLALSVLLLYKVPGLAGGADVVEARSFVLRGDGGATLGEWKVGDDGATRLTFRDAAGVQRLSLAVVDGSPGLSLAAEDGGRRVVLGLLPDRTATLVFADREGIPRAVMGLSRDEAANLVFADAGGISRVGFGVERNGLGSVLLPDDTGDSASAGDGDGR